MSAETLVAAMAVVGIGLMVLCIVSLALDKTMNKRWEDKR